MKKIKWFALACFAVLLALVACNKNTPTVDPAPIQKSFASSEPSTKTSADKAVNAIKAGDYAGALAELKTLAGNARLTPEQQQAIKDVMAQVQSALTAGVDKAKTDASKTVDDLKKSMQK